MLTMHSSRCEALGMTGLMPRSSCPHLEPHVEVAIEILSSRLRVGACCKVGARRKSAVDRTHAESRPEEKHCETAAETARDEADQARQ